MQGHSSRHSSVYLFLSKVVHEAREERAYDAPRTALFQIESYEAPIGFLASLAPLANPISVYCAENGTLGRPKESELHHP